MNTLKSRKNSISLFAEKQPIILWKATHHSIKSNPSFDEKQPKIEYYPQVMIARISSGPMDSDLV